MDTKAIVILTIDIALSLFMALALFGVWDRILTGKWPEYLRSDKSQSRKGEILYVGMSDYWLDKNARCDACDALFTETGGFYFFENGPWKCCILCYDNVSMNVVAANIFQRRKDWRLHEYFCDCKGPSSKPIEERVV